MSGTNDQHDFREGLTHEVIIIVVHPEYDTKTFENDIAICTVRIEINFSLNVVLIQLSKIICNNYITFLVGRTNKNIKFTTANFVGY